MATDASRLNWVNAVDTTNSSIFIRLVVYKDDPGGDVVDTNTTATTITLKQLAELLKPLVTAP